MGGGKTNKNTCTLGIDKAMIVESNGILNYLKQKGITIVTSVMFDTAHRIQTSKDTSEKSKLGFRVTTEKITRYSGKKDIVDIEELIMELDEYGITPLVQPTSISLTDLNGHEITLQRKGQYIYRVSAIDGKSIYNSFTKEQIEKLQKNSVTTMMCEITRSINHRYEFHCEKIE